jgi:hypothetical protein
MHGGKVTFPGRPQSGMRRRFRPSAALIVASVALFVALGSGAYAAGIIDGHSIKNHSIPANKLTRTAIASLRGQRGPRGLTGPAGPTGANGGFDPSKVSYTSSGDVAVAPDPGGTTVGTATAVCPAGTKVVGGGFVIGQGNDGGAEVFGSGPNSDGSAWLASIHNDSPSVTAHISAFADCAGQ